MNENYLVFSGGNVPIAIVAKIWTAGSAFAQ